MKIEIWLIYLQLRRFFTALKTFIWVNVVCRKMKSPTKRIFYHFGSDALYLAPFWLHFGIVGTVGRCSATPVGQNFACACILMLKRHLKSLS